MNNYKNPHYKPIGDGFTVLSSWSLPDAGAQFDEVECPYGRFMGTRVTQDGRTYIGRDWKMTKKVKNILSKAAEEGFPKFWRNNHPQNAYDLGGRIYCKGVHHIGCSKSHEDPWIFVLGAECLLIDGGLQKIKSITFNKKYMHLVKKELSVPGKYQKPINDPFNIRGNYKKTNFGSKDLTTHPADFNRIIEYIARNL